MKAAQSVNVSVSDLFRAIAGSPEAQFDMIACTVYSAAHSVMRSGNKTAFLKLESDCKLYGTDTTEANKLVKDLLGVKTLNAAVKQFKKTYFALSVTLDQCGFPEMLKDLPKPRAEQDIIVNPLADDYAQQFTSIFTANMSLTEKTEAERAAESAKRKADREAKKALEAQAKAEAEVQADESEAAMQEAIKAEAARIALPTLADMARMVADALRAGSLDADIEAAIIEAAQTRETAVLLAGIAHGEPATA